VASSPDDPNDLPTSDDWGRMIQSQRHDHYTPMFVAVFTVLDLF
jgi:hypothetical protein